MLRRIGLCTGTKIGRRNRPGRLWREARRLGHKLLSHFANLQLQALFAGKDAAVGQLETIGCLRCWEHSMILKQLHDQIAALLQNLAMASLFG